MGFPGLPNNVDPIFSLAQLAFAPYLTTLALLLGTARLGFKVDQGPIIRSANVSGRFVKRNEECTSLRDFGQSSVIDMGSC